MPTYPHKCNSCGHPEEVVRRVANRNDPVTCSACGGACGRVIVAPLISPDYTAYNSPIDGRLIQGKREHLADLARNGCRIREPGETRENAQRREAAQASFEKAVDADIDRAAYQSGVLR
jgi:putative FmdB family regulatory protein